MRSTRVAVHLTAFVLRSRPSYTPSEPAGCHCVRHVEQVDEEVVRQRLGLLGEDAVLGLPGVGAEHAQAADENRHLGRRQRQQLRPIHQRLLGRHELLDAADIVAEAVGTRLERREGLRVGLFLRRVHAPRREGNLHVDRRHPSPPFRPPRSRRERSGRRARPSAPAVELLLDRFELRQHRRELRRLVDLPVLLRAETDARAVGAAALVGAAERRCRCPGGRDELRHRQAGREDLRLQRRDVLARRSADGSPAGSGPARSASPSARAGRDSAGSGPCRDA